MKRYSLDTAIALFLIRDSRADTYTERSKYSDGVSRWKTIRRKIRRAVKGDSVKIGRIPPVPPPDPSCLAAKRSLRCDPVIVLDQRRSSEEITEPLHPPEFRKQTSFLPADLAVPEQV